MSEDKYIRIGKYWDGELEGEELYSFEQELKENKAFADEVMLFKEVGHHLITRGQSEQEAIALRATLSKIVAEETKVIPIDKTSKKRSYSLWAAASLIVLIGLSMVYMLQTGTPNYEDYAKYDELSLMVRSTNEDQELYKKAETAFNAGHYQEAEDLFERILEKDQTQIEVRLYQAIANIEVGNYSKANKLLEEISGSSSAYVYQSLWYLGLSELKQGDLEACSKVLKRIPKEADEYEKAQELIKKID